MNLFSRFNEIDSIILRFSASNEFNVSSIFTAFLSLNSIELENLILKS
jgi:hypothetical protein